jgi:hypothetical protein
VEEDTTKYKTAKSLGIPIITDKNLLEMIWLFEKFLL